MNEEDDDDLFLDNSTEYLEEQVGVVMNGYKYPQYYCPQQED